MTTARWWHGWEAFVLLPALVIGTFPAAWPRWIFMWTLAIAIFAGCKWLSWRRTRVNGAAWYLHLGYLVIWPGMDAASFLGDSDSTPPRIREWLFVVTKLLAGLVILFGLTRLVPAQWPYATGWVGMIGLVLILHFGGFHLLSCVWRRGGVDARPLMHWPLASVSVSEFWGRRWNTAFRDLTHRFLFRPLTSRIGPRRAIFAGFVMSGLVHDLVISMPARGGYGGPTVFFLLQAVAMFVERSRTGRRWGLGRGIRGWCFTAATLLLPAGLLFHVPFVHNIVLPFLAVLGAT